MKTFDEMQYHPTSERLVNILCEKTGNPSPLFFRVQVAYYFSMLASMMRTSILTLDRGEIPVNLYAMNLATSGSGKGYSTNIMEKEVIHKFRQNFLDNTFPTLAENNLPILSAKRAARKSTDPDDELIRTQKEFDELGTLVFSFDSGTSAAVKQLRHKLLMANAGSMNLQMDEIGTNLLANTEVLGTLLELYDVGLIKTKLLKNTSDNKRFEEIVGPTPTNMLLFGTPSNLLDGDKVEKELYSMLETGYARRCFWGFSRPVTEKPDLTPEQVLDMLTKQDSNEYLEQLSHTLERLADIANINKKLVISRDTTLLLIEYRQQCEKIANTYSEHEEIKKAEISHRYFKALKLAGAYAFIDDSAELTADHLYNAIKLAEESGDAFNRLLSRERPYVKLAKYVASVGKEVTQADLTEDLPFYRGSISSKQEMLTLATAWGYKNNIIIKKSFSDGIEFLRGESLKPTDLNKMRLAWSTDVAVNYRGEEAPWDKLTVLTGKPGLHWTNHHMVDGHRQEDNAVPGFNMIVLDVEGSVTMDVAKQLLSGYRYLLYTTKRHRATDGDGVTHGDRFRILMPTNYRLDMDAREYKEFMNNVFEWLPFSVDAQTNQRARKWMSCAANLNGVPSESFYNEGELLDVLPFIPKTSKNEERKKVLDSQQSMDNLERWVINNTGDGNRNNMLLRFAMILVDTGRGIDEIRQRVLDLNDKLMDKLDQIEIYNTIMVSVTKAIAKRP